MSGTDNLEFLRGTPLRTFARPFSEGHSLFDGFIQVEFGGSKFPIAIESKGKKLFLGQQILLRGNSAGYVPGEMKPGEEAVVVGFTEPNSNQAMADELVRVIGRDAMELTPISVKPDNIGGYTLPSQITGEPKEGERNIDGTTIGYVYVPSAEAEGAHVLALHYKRNDKERLIKIGDQIHTDEKSGGKKDAVVTGFHVGLNPIGTAQALIKVNYMDGKMQRLNVINYDEVANV